MPFNEHQQRLLSQMRLQIDIFKRGEIGFRRLVDNLLGLMDAGDFEDKAFRHAWFERWGSLEIACATDGDDVTPADVSSELEALRIYLGGILGDR